MTTPIAHHKENQLAVISPYTHPAREPHLFSDLVHCFLYQYPFHTFVEINLLALEIIIDRVGQFTRRNFCFEESFGDNTGIGENLDAFILK